MPLQKITFKPGVNRENTRYTTEGGWYECDKVRFRQGNPESIGGWQRLSGYTYQGVCRSLWNWVTLVGQNLLGVGTNLKFYIEDGGIYSDITPIRATETLGTNPFTGNGTTTVTVNDTSHGAILNDFVTFSGVTGAYAGVLNGEFQITSVINANSYTIIAASVVAVGATGGTAVVAAYQINSGAAVEVPYVGWGAGGWGTGGWGAGIGTLSLRLWSQKNYGEDLIFGPRGGGIYYWDATTGIGVRGKALNSLGGTVSITAASPAVVTSTVLYTEGAALQFNVTTGGSLPTGIVANTTYYAFNVEGLTFNLTDANGNVVNTSGSASVNAYVSLIVDVPTEQHFIVVSDTSRFIFAMGCNGYNNAPFDPMLIRWSAQDDPYNWTPNEVNQAGDVRLSSGSEIITAVQTRQEIVVITNSSVYSLQFLGPPFVWGSQLLGDNISIAGPNAATVASGVVYWMGVDKFYAYDGRVQTLNCDLRRYVFGDFNFQQTEQVYCGTNEGFNEVWWFYCSANNNTAFPDKYVVFNYLEQAWYYGTMSRTAWLDTPLRQHPVAATPSYNIVLHELGINNNETGTTQALDAYISSSEFDIGDGHNFGFIWRVLPDLTFQNSSNSPSNVPPQLTMTLYGMVNSGSGVTDTASQAVEKGNNYVITEEFTGQIYTRCRGRQMIFRVGSNQINTAWQLGAPRIDIRPDGRR
jgi:hypothetical protein